jgi:hypothetical protein
MADPVADTTAVEIIEYPKELFRFTRPAETPVLPAPTLGTRTVSSAEEQAAAEAEGWYADQAAALAATATPRTPAPEPEPEPEPEVTTTTRRHR